MIQRFLIEPVPDNATNHLWRRVDTGEVKLLNEFPEGAMWYAPWMARTPEPDWRLSDEAKQLPSEERVKGHLVVKTPGGHWDIDSPASGKTSGWVRTGVAPLITARPSIFHDPPRGWHGWLTDGVLTSV